MTAQLEVVTGIAGWGTYDDGQEAIHQRLRDKASRVFALKYRLLKRFEQGQCGCGKCAVLPGEAASPREDDHHVGGMQV